MKSIRKYSAVLLVVLAGGWLSCTKSFDEKVTQQQDFSTSSLLQVYMGTVSATRNFVFVDYKPVTGSLLTYGNVFPATAHAFVVPGGQRSFLIRDTLTSSTQTPLSFAENMETGKHYTIFMYDTINAAKQKTVETNIVVPADTTARMRFANFIFSKTAVPAVDIFSKRGNVNLFTNVQVTQVTDFIPVPSDLTDTLFVRETGTTNQLAVLNGITPTEKRSYTLVFRGRYQTTSGTIARTLSSFVNY